MEAQNSKRVARQKARRINQRAAIATENIPLVNPAPRRTAPVNNVHAATTAIQKRVEECRTDLTKFYNFVIRHELSKQVLKAAPHQEVSFRFLIDHPMCVIRQPIGTGKTFGSAALVLWLMGIDSTQRGGLVSKIQQQSSKVLRMVSDYITEPELNKRLQMVFPELVKGTRKGDIWTQTALTIKRPPGIRDPSVIAVGLDGAIGGARLSWMVGDDILDADNCMTKDSRDLVHSRFDSRFLSRLDPTGSRCIVTNTPWDREDLTFKLESAGWPTISMDVYGFIKFSNVSEEWILKTGLLERSQLREGYWRLAKHGPDEKVPLWPERYSAKQIAEIRSMRLPHEFARLFLCEPFNSDAARCQRDWIEECKRQGRGQWKPGQQIKWDRGNPIYTGVDLAIGANKKHDETSILTFELLPDKRRRLISLECGRWSGPEIVSRIIATHDKYGSVLSVEDNAGQDFIRQFALAQRSDLRVRSHTTNPANKHHVDFGVESMFTELKQMAWIFPCDHDGSVPNEFAKLFEECMFYQPPPAHTGDRLMAMWIGRESCRRGGGGRDPKPTTGLKLQFASTGGF